MKTAPNRSVSPRLVVARDLDGIVKEFEPVSCRHETPSLQKYHGPHMRSNAIQPAMAIGPSTTIPCEEPYPQASASTRR